jgi:hypothetical protein
VSAWLKRLHDLVPAPYARSDSSDRSDSAPNGPNGPIGTGMGVRNEVSEPACPQRVEQGDAWLDDPAEPCSWSQTSEPEPIV